MGPLRISLEQTRVCKYKYTDFLKWKLVQKQDRVNFLIVFKK